MPLLLHRSLMDRRHEFLTRFAPGARRFCLCRGAENLAYEWIK